MKQYRIWYWEAGRKYCMVVGATSIDSLKSHYKRIYNRVIIEECEYEI